MRRSLILAALAASLAVPARAQAPIVAPITTVAHSGKWHYPEVVDGDTIDVKGAGIAQVMRMRIDGIDAPETRTTCDYERDLARKATARLAELVKGGVWIISEVEFDQWVRMIATKVINREGQDVAQTLIREGLARPYDGKTARQPWCPAP